MGLFEQLKRDKSFSIYSQSTRAKKAENIFFLIGFDDQGSFVEVVNNKLEPVEFDYNFYEGPVRSLAKSIQLIQDKNSFAIDWENPEQRVYLHEHPYLIRLLIESEKMVDHSGESVVFNSLPGQASLHITRNEESGDLSANIIISDTEKAYRFFRFIAEDYAFLFKENSLIKVGDVGRFFNEAHLFDVEKMHENDLQKYLSLFFSFFENVNLKFDEYKVVRKPDILKARPAIIFERVDEDHSLYMRISQIMPNADINFLDDYDLKYFVFLNEIENTINVHPIGQVHLTEAVVEIEKALRRYMPKKKSKDDAGFTRDEALFIVSEKVASEFIYKEIPHLINDFALVGSEKLKDYKINVAKPRLNVSLGHGIDFLDGDASLDFGNQQISLIDALNQYKKNKYVLLADGTHAIVNEQYMQKLQRLFRKKKDEKGRIEVSFFDLPLIEEMIEERAGEASFKKSREVFEGFNKLAKKKEKLPEVNATLRPYQIQGFKWLKYLYDNQLGGCLADDMGLGKTLQAITLLTEVYSQKKKDQPPSILVMPRSLIFNWEKELEKFSPTLTYYTWYGNDRDWETAKEHNLILTTYALLRNDIEIWKEKKFLYVILDESQATKNYNSQVHKASLLLKAEHRLAMSGTPVENNLSELYSLFRFLNPTMFGSAENFNQNYLTPIQKLNDQDAAKELKKKIYPFILRRLKSNVLKDLPEKIEQTLYVEMTPAQQRFYEQRRLFYKNAIDEQVAMKGIQQSQFFIFQALNELRQIATIPESQTDGKIHSPKLELLIENIEDAVSNRHKVLVFCNFLSAVELIGEELDKKGIDFVTMTGSTRNRKELVERFQNDSDCKVFILTLKTGGTGLNLTAADMVFIFDPWWNKAAENQAIDRTHRIGQTKTVMSYKLITLGSIEEKMLQLQEVKSKLFEDIVSTDSSSLKSISEEDIKFILE